MIRSEQQISGKAFRAVMAHWATGVAIVTGQGMQGRHGMTANSVCSVSLEPPILMVSLTTSGRTERAVAAGKVFGVNVLAAEQHELAARFARPRWEFAERVGQSTYFRGETGIPLLQECLAWLECRVSQ